MADCTLNPELLSLTSAVAVANAVGGEARIKWPNDIILNGKKVAGILLESRAYNNRIAYTIGVGINCHQTKDSFPSELQHLATSIDIESGSICNRISLAKRLLTSMDHWLEIAEKNSKEIIDQWRKLGLAE